jgi:hypothetical protein
MKELDLEALLKLNPQVDREAIRLRREKLLKGNPKSPARGADSVSPYGGKRLTPDDKAKWPANKVARRSGYAGR